jgi:hypothetical protein
VIAMVTFLLFGKCDIQEWAKNVEQQTTTDETNVAAAVDDETAVKFL